jgi:hypothetical protein
MAVDQAQQWLPDPAGKHQFRLHSDGKPTEWVSDDGSMTIDRLESAPSAPPADPTGPTVASVQPGSTSLGSASNSQPPAATPPVRPAGWYRNASNPSEVRYWDGSDWAVDQTVATATPSSSPAPSPAAPVGSLPDTGSVAPVAHPEPDALRGVGSPPPLDPTSPGGSFAGETAVGPDTPGRHSAGRNLSADGYGLAGDTPTVSSVWAQPEVPGDRTPAPTPPPVVTQVAPAAPVAQLAPAAPVAAAPPAPVVAPPADGTTPDPTATVPADWYPDPSDRTRLRYWDGAGWTVHVLDEAPTPRH